ncbi:MAG TPA: EthD family reductase [Dehalococcoidia bacterium]|nr:EthD family reductase [Dehalococcoidia bacterium]
MYRLSAYYPHGGKFDLEYYKTKHMPMVKEKVGSAIERWEVDNGLSGVAPGSNPPNIAVGHLYFNSLDEFAKAFGQHAPAIMADTANFTDIAPQIQVSEIIEG